MPRKQNAGGGQGQGQGQRQRQKSGGAGAGKFFGTPLGVTVLILSIVGVLLLSTVLALYFSGIRYVNHDFVEQLTGERYSIRFIGKTDGNGIPLSGTVHYADGSTAALSGKDGVYRVEYKNGDIYEGPLLQLQKHGKGVLTLASGDRYEGEFAYDEMSGEGRYEYITGDVYEGNFAAGKKSGYGVYTWAPDEENRTAKYEGYFEKDLRNGDGTFTYADGTVYKGGFKDDKKEDVSGEFTIRNADGSTDVYVGGFVGDVREGYGEYTWASGDVYKGEFRNNLLDGEGTYIWADGRTYKGSFTAGKIDADGHRILHLRATQSPPGEPPPAGRPARQDNNKENPGAGVR